jgi:hypothetical protein
MALGPSRWPGKLAPPGGRPVSIGVKASWDAPLTPGLVRLDLVRDARRSRLATALAESRGDELRTLLAVLWRERTLGRSLESLS